MGKKEKGTPETRKIRVLNAAFQDIYEITNFIAVNNEQPLNAIKVAETLWETINKIEQNPFVYKGCEEIPTKTKMYRKATCISWLIIYKITYTEIIILGVIPGTRKTSKIKTLKKIK